MTWRDRVLRRPRAETDVVEQFDYYAFVEGVPDVALRFANALEIALERLCQFPHIGSPCPLGTLQLRDLRRWPIPEFESHHLFYRVVDGDLIDLVRVVHTARDLRGLLANELDDEP